VEEDELYIRITARTHISMLLYQQAHYDCLNVVHHAVFYNNGTSTEQSVNHKSNIILNALLSLATCFDL
jgi:hypothetical protein